MLGGMTEDKFERRRRRLKKLIDERFDGVPTALAKKIGREPSYVARALYPESKKGRKHIGDAFMELIETELNLPRGWINADDEPLPPAVPAVDADTHEVLTYWRLLLPEEKAKMLDAMRPLAAHNRAVMEKLGTYTVTPTASPPAPEPPPTPEPEPTAQSPVYAMSKMKLEKAHRTPFVKKKGVKDATQ